jgi:hypothetical protein
MHVCKATIQDQKSVEFGILEFFPDFWEKISKKCHGFLSKTYCSTKICSKQYFFKVQKDLG